MKGINMICPGQINPSDKFRENWDRIFGKEEETEGEEEEDDG